MIASRRAARLVAGLVVSWAITSPSSAFADEDASALVRQGVALRRDHRNDEAAAVFARAAALSPKPSVRAQLALAEQAVARWLDAEHDLDAALAAEDDPWIAKNRAALEENRGIVRQHLGWITVDCDVEGADVRLDGRALSRGTQTRAVVGEGALDVTATGYLPEARRVTIASAEHLRVPVTLAPPAREEGLPA